MFKTITEWWNLLKAWATGSSTGAKREAVETYLSSEDFRDRVQQWDDYILTHDRFPQILRGGGRPSDRGDQEGFVHNIPGWVDFEVHEWEGPNGKGFKIIIYVSEAGKDWKLEVERPWNIPEWQEVVG